MTRAWTRSCAACCVRKGLIFLVLCRSSSFCNVLFESELVIENYPKICDWAEGYCWWIYLMVKSCCRVGVRMAGRQEAQSLPGWAVDGVLSSMPRCPPGSLRSVQLLLDHLVEMRDRAVCHQRRNGRRYHVLVWWDQWCSVCGEEEGSKNRSLRNPSDWPVDVLWIPPLPRPPWKNNQWDRIQTSEVESQWCPVMRGWSGGFDG